MSERIRGGSSRLVIGAFCAAVLAGVTACGADSPQPLPADARAALHTLVKDIRSATEEGRERAARRATARLSQEIARLRDRGALNPGDAAALQARAEAIRMALPAADSPAATGTPTPTDSAPTDPTSDPTSDPEQGTDEDGGDAGQDQRDRGEGKDRGKDRGKDKKNDKGEDGDD